MEDKTAKIPSIKNFSSDNRKKKSAEHSDGTRTYERKSPSPQRRERSSAESRHSGARPPQSKTKSTPRVSGADRKDSAPAPRTYARQRQDVSDALSKTRVIRTDSDYPEATPQKRSNEFSSEPLKKRRSSSSQSRTYSYDRRPASSDRTSASEHRRTSGNRRSSAENTSAGDRKPQKGKKKPLSPRARRFRRFVINTALCLLVLVVGVILALTVMFKTEEIVVSGNGNIPKKDIINVSGLVTGENIFTAPKKKAAERLEKAYPYIQEAEIKSVFPNAISIDITMANPSCIVEGLGGYYVVSSEGKVLEVASTTDEIDAPVIEGVNVGGKVAGDFVDYGNNVIGDALRELFTAFEEFGCTRITGVNVQTKDEAVELKYVYDNRIVVYLGIPEHITYKVQTAHTIIKEKIDTGGTMIAGDLDVSMCHDSMKSYFNQYTLLAPNSAHATEPATTEAQEDEPDIAVYYY